MPEFVVHRILLQVEEVRHEGGPAPSVPLRKAAALAVVANPFSGRYVDDIASGMPDLEALGAELATRLVDTLGGDPGIIEGYGKGAIVGADGELEHGALWHVPGGYAMRHALGEALAIVPSSKKVGGPSCSLDVPITHRDASYVRSHFDAMQVRCPGAPARDELVLALVMTTGSRIHARVGGLAAEDIENKDGLR